MASRDLEFPVFDADNHMYETTDALTKFMPPEFRGVIDYVEVRGRTKIAVKGKISNYIPNPTFNVVGPPGAWEQFYREGKPGREVHSGDDGAADQDAAGVLRARRTSEADG